MGASVALPPHPSTHGCYRGPPPTPAPMGAPLALTLPGCLADGGGLHPLPQRARGRAPTHPPRGRAQGQASCRAGGWGVSVGGWPGHPPRPWLQVLGREGPFPLILLPQFGGYWIEGTNHQLSGAPTSPPAAAPGARAKLEGNHTAKIYRKHFLGRVSPCRWLGAWGGVGSPRVRVGTGTSQAWVLHGTWVPRGMGACAYGCSRARVTRGCGRLGAQQPQPHGMGAPGAGCPMDADAHA